MQTRPRDPTQHRELPGQPSPGDRVGWGGAFWAEGQQVCAPAVQRQDRTPGSRSAGTQSRALTTDDVLGR